MGNFEDLKKQFKNPELAEKALTHRSWVNENAQNTGTNERLEFLGDAVLEFVVSDKLYKKFSDKEEGFLTALRANIVNADNLARLAQKLSLGEHIKLSRGEEQGGGRSNPSLMSDTVEAVIGAIYLDRGFSQVEEFIVQFLLADLDQKLKEPLKDAKSRLQEMVQAQGFPAPKYRIVQEEGPDHEKQFKIEVLVGGKPKGVGEGKSKAKAEQAAAEAALANWPQKE